MMGLEPTIAAVLMAGKDNATPADQDGPTADPNVLGFLVACQERRQLRSRLWWCWVGGWLMMTTAAAIGCFFALRMNHFMHEILKSNRDDDGFSWFSVSSPSTPPWTSLAAAPVLGAVAVLLVAIAVVAVLRKRLPGADNALLAIDWANTADAVARLLDHGKTYPETFRLVARTCQTGHVRQWLLRSAQRIESGYGGAISGAAGVPLSGDAALLTVLVDHSGDQPQIGWQAARDHFDSVSHRRGQLTLALFPVFAVLVSGLLLWLSMATTMGWIWYQVLEIINSFSNNSLF
ncbi:hypothetical protein [Stieleria varia]|uniref:Bacterial type II secretion system protein F domain protein n=1 Tax=Stieleria varia TaxID=2528005 RepID=A0A5C6ADX5_9BACT|nr:hypothetical protein [Stieleria varia]TWT98252.1 hypothetical protein Pla52n_47620 [Stieleria varia]